MLQIIKDKIKTRHILKQEENCWQKFMRKHPIFRGIFSHFKCTHPKCLICQEVERRKERFWRCENQQCRVSYCDECWEEIGRDCLVCVYRRGEKLKECETDSDYYAEYYKTDWSE